MREMPAISSASYTSSTMPAAALYAQAIAANRADEIGEQHAFNALMRGAIPAPAVNNVPRKENPMASQTRLVQVFIADANDNIPLDKRLLHSGEQKLTDLTDQELFFEIDIKSMLDKHNDVRTTTINKSVKERTEYLEPARIRDLKMTVVTIAQF